MIVLSAIFLFMYAVNSLIPLCYGDDYLYSFVWKEGQHFFEPLPEDARRIGNWGDYFDSLWAHYFSHSGRLVNFVPIFFFLWQGKEYFNVFNAFLFVLLIAEIYWITNQGRISLHFDPAKLCWIFFAIWILSPGFFHIFLWLTGSCNYFFSTVLVIGFLLPYMQLWETKKINLYYKNKSYFKYIIFVYGILSGWTNENTGCFIILLLALMIYQRRKLGVTIQAWEIMGLTGFSLGYLLLIMAPGNFVRLTEDMEYGLFFSDFRKIIYNNGITFLIGFFFQLPLWAILWSILKKAKQCFHPAEEKSEIMGIYGFVFISLGANVMMIFLPEFPIRSLFPGFVYLLIATILAVRFAEKIGWTLWKKNLCQAFCIFCFVLTSCISFYGWEKLCQYDRMMFDRVQAEKHSPTMEVLEIKKLEMPYWVYPLSGFHTASLSLKEDDASWVNIAYVRYHGIRGIRAFHTKEF